MLRLLQDNNASDYSNLLPENAITALNRLKARPAPGQVTNRYHYVDTETTLHRLSLAFPEIDLKSASVSARRTYRDSSHVIRVNVGSQVTLFDSTVQPQLVLRNSFGGESCFQATLGFFRLVCANGLTVGTHLAEPIILKHLVGQKFDTEWNSFVRNVDALLSSDFKAKVESKMNPRIPLERLREVLGALPGVSARIQDKVHAIFVHRLARVEDRTAGKQAVSLWDIWQVVNETMRLYANQPNGLAVQEREAKLMDSILRVA